MARKKLTPEERERFAQQRAEWAKQAQEFRDLYERRLARQRAEDERRARRRRLLRRVFLFGRAA